MVRKTERRSGGKVSPSPPVAFGCTAAVVVVVVWPRNRSFNLEVQNLYSLFVRVLNV